jgi:hypothetical protein
MFDIQKNNIEQMPASQEGLSCFPLYLQTGKDAVSPPDPRVGAPFCTTPEFPSLFFSSSSSPPSCPDDEVSVFGG